MSRKSLFLAIGIVLFLLSGTGAVLVVLLRHEPAFYRRAAVPPGPERSKHSDDFVRVLTNNLWNGILSKKSWEARFTEEQINSYFAEDFLTKHSAENPFPPGVSEPRVALDADHIRLGFRYGSGFWSTIISLNLRVWLVHREPNVVAVEFESLSAGAVPCSAQSILERVTDIAQQQNIEVNWYRRAGHPVVLLRFQADQKSPTFLLHRLELRPGILDIVGRPVDERQRAQAASGKKI
jgi:hypothetical protein